MKIFDRLLSRVINLEHKCSPAFWNNFARREHYFNGSIVLEEAKAAAYKRFLEEIGLGDGLTLKTDLYVESKNKKDTFLMTTGIKRCLGMDISLEIVKQARNNLRVNMPEMQFVVGDARRLPFKEASFQAIISDSTLDHMPRQDMECSLKEFRRVLSAKGMCVVALNNMLNPVSLYDSTVKNICLKEYFLSFCYRPGYVLSVLKKIGFSPQRWEGIIAMDFLGLVLVRLSRRLKVLEPLVRMWISFLEQLRQVYFLRNFISLQFIVASKKI